MLHLTKETKQKKFYRLFVDSVVYRRRTLSSPWSASSVQPSDSSSFAPRALNGYQSPGTRTSTRTTPTYRKTLACVHVLIPFFFHSGPDGNPARRSGQEGAQEGALYRSQCRCKRIRGGRASRKRTGAVTLA